jgi:hypothetical protein
VARIEFLRKPRRVWAEQVHKFTLVDTPLGPASLCPGDWLVHEEGSDLVIPYHNTDFIRDFLPLSTDAAIAYDRAVNRVSGYVDPKPSAEWLAGEAQAVHRAMNAVNPPPASSGPTCHPEQLAGLVGTTPTSESCVVFLINNADNTCITIPKSCRTCGIGPCHFVQPAAVYHDRKEGRANAA